MQFCIQCWLSLYKNLETINTKLMQQTKQEPSPTKNKLKCWNEAPTFSELDISNLKNYLLKSRSNRSSAGQFGNFLIFFT